MRSLDYHNEISLPSSVTYIKHANPISVLSDKHLNIVKIHEEKQLISWNCIKFSSRELTSLWH